MGPHFPLPVEISQFAHNYTVRLMKGLPAAQGCEPIMRRGDCSNNKLEPDKELALTDNGNYVVDLKFKDPIADAKALAAQV